MKKVITYGTFDLLHYGHINLLKRAKSLGDYLIVGLSTDDFNQRDKNKNTYFCYQQRRVLLESLRYVDLVIPEFSWEQKVSDIMEFKIDVFVIGDDWIGKFDELKKYCEVIYLERTPEVSTTQIKNDLGGGDMNNIQILLFDIAIEFDRICKKNNLRYFISAGTLLGAVRHQGFIPWDDDIDFYMPREDYERFLKIAPQELRGRYALRDYSVDGKKYEYCFAKIDDKTTTFIEKSSANYHYKGGVWIDIFPLDGTFESKVLQKIHLFFVAKMVKLRNKAYIFNIHQKMGITHRLHLKILRFLMKGDGAYRLINTLLQIKKYNQSKYVGNLVWGYKMKEIVPKDYYEPQGVINFENHMFSSPHKPHQYLEQIYGDYMKLPPKEERVSRHPIYFVDLKKSYKEFEYSN